jgi:hypothetical protein
MMGEAITFFLPVSIQNRLFLTNNNAGPSPAGCL